MEQQDEERRRKVGGGNVTVIRGAKRWLQRKDRRNENGGKKDTEEGEMKVFWRPLYVYSLIFV